MTFTFAGVWPAVLIENLPDGSLDLPAIDTSVSYFAKANVSGVYTGDTASEFYTLEFDEWNDLATHFRAVTQTAKLPAGIGCTWTNQAGAVRRIERARELGYDQIHLSQPYWIALNERSQTLFWSAVGEAAGDLPIIVYGGSQGQFPLNSATIKRLLRWSPSIAGTKQTGFDGVATHSLLVDLPQLSHFVHEQLFAPLAAVGAAGCMSNLAGLSAEFMMRWYELIRTEEWGAAFEVQRRVSRFYEAGAVPIRRAGYGVDKALAELGGQSGVTRNLRPPYAPVPDDLYAGLADAARRHLPECFDQTLEERP